MSLPLQYTISPSNILGIPRSWDILYEGKRLIDFTSLVSLSAKLASDITDKPVESTTNSLGGFVTINRVNKPITMELEITQSGFLVDQQEALKVLIDSKNKGLLLTVLSPLRSYENMAIQEVNYSQTVEDGAYFLLAKVSLKEIRVINSSYGTQTIKPKSVTDASKQEQGKKQPTSVAVSGVDYLKGLVR